MGKMQPIQSEFVRKIGVFILAAYELGYELTFGDAWDQDKDGGHIKSSHHYLRLAIDFNVFRDGIWLTETHQLTELGDLWESFGPGCTWGGRFQNPDGNHFSYTE